MLARPATLHVLAADDDEAASLAALLATAGYATLAHDSAAALLASQGAEAASGPSDPGRGLPRPCAVVADAGALGEDGLALLLRPRRADDDASAEAPVVLVAAQPTVRQAVRAMRSGAVDFLEKPLDSAALFAAVERALDRSRSAEAGLSVRAEARRRLQTLVPRERAVLERLLVRGVNKAIASDLGLSPRTVELYRARIMAKTKVAGLPELVRLAIEAGIWGRGGASPDDAPPEDASWVEARPAPRSEHQEREELSA